MGQASNKSMEDIRKKVYSYADAQKQIDRYDAMHGDRANPVKVTATKAGPKYRRALEALMPEDVVG